MPKPLQPSTSTFRDLINGGYLYVDKTRHIYELVRGSKGVYFFARPRRFGKSLFISTLDVVFRGNRELFKGLWINDSDYQWEAHPVKGVLLEILAGRQTNHLCWSQFWQ